MVNQAAVQGSLPLHYRVRPVDASGGQPPMLILFHGNYGNEDSLFDQWAQFDSDWLILSPRAPYTRGPNEYTWLDVEGVPAESEREEAHRKQQQAATTVLSFIEQAVEQYWVDPQQVYLLGFSQGASVAGTIGLLAPFPIAGAVMLCGYVWPPTVAYLDSQDQLVRRKFLVVHGLHDPLTPLQLGWSNRDLLRQLPVELDYREYDMKHEVTAACHEDVRMWLRAARSAGS